MLPPAPASTVVLIRPAAAAYEVFLVRRHDRVAFMGGAHVFPGGRVDPADLVEEPGRWCSGAEAAAVRMPQLPRHQAIAFHVAAVRELFEEAGVLLARDERGSSVAIGEREERRFAEYRQHLNGGTMSMRDVAERERLQLALDALTLFAHWVTPPVEARRFDTYFFLAVTPPAQRAAHDDREMTEGEWMGPAEAIDRCMRGEIALPPPTWTTLRALSRCRDIDEAVAWASAQTAPRIEPCFIERSDGTRIVMLPGDPACPPVEGFSAGETRFLLENGRWKPIEVGGIPDLRPPG